MERAQFAETAVEAWAPVAGVVPLLRKAARDALIATAAPFTQDAADVVRCLYSHAVFPEHRDAFRAFLRDLKNRGDVISTSTLLEIVASGCAASGRHFHLSFDDALANVFEVAAEEIAAAKVPATVYVPTDLVGQDYETLASYFRNLSAYAKPVRLASWDQIRAGAAAGVEIGSHTRRHARLSALEGDAARLQDEIATSKVIIEEKLGRPCKSFAWPYGTMADIGPQGAATIRSAGYTSAFSAVRGRVRPGTSDPFDLPRHHVEFHWPASQIAAWTRGFRED